MKQTIFAALATLGILALVATAPANAQLVGQPGTSAISPYINLLPRTQAINYYGLVRPQFQYNTAISSLEQQVQANRVAATAADTQGPVTTGHPVQFLNYRRYFQTLGTTSAFQNVQASGRALGAGNLPAGTGIGTPGTRSSGLGISSYGGIGGYGGIGNYGGIGAFGGGYRPGY
jgi:hypothetical protein